MIYTRVPRSRRTGILLPNILNAVRVPSTNLFGVILRFIIDNNNLAGMPALCQSTVNSSPQKSGSTETWDNNGNHALPLPILILVAKHSLRLGGPTVCRSPDSACNAPAASRAFECRSEAHSKTLVRKLLQSSSAGLIA